jgi:ribosomal protein S6--L-glutamate ligase
VGVSVGCLLDRRSHEMPTPLLRSVFARLEASGCEVDWMVPEEQLTWADGLTPEYDLYLLKSQTELALSLAAILHAQGARLVNRYPGCAAARDKIVAAHRLRAAEIPTPWTWVTAEPALIEPLLERGPIVVKPHRGLHGAEVHVVRSPAELAALPAPQGPVIAQDYVAGGGQDLKLYVVGEQVFGVRKAFSSGSFSEPGRPCEVPPAAHDVALRCGQAFGLSLYGLDVIESRYGPVVVDVNYFPGYRGVPDADVVVAEHLERLLAAT